MSTKDQVLSAMLHGEALLRARRSELKPLVTELGELAAGRDDIRVECAGTIAGSWFASPGTEYGHELIAAGLLLMSGPVDRDLLKEWVRTGYERGQGTWLGYGPSSPPGSPISPSPDSCEPWAVGRPVKGEIRRTRASERAPLRG